jgi:DnaJ-class molecular chaperone
MFKNIQGQVDADYYSILGVDRKCTKENIKKAFRKMAIIHHPDKSGDQEKFKQINEAYNILIDDEKRSMYDRFGQQGILLHQQKQAQQTQNKIEIQQIIINIPFTICELYNGCTKKITINRVVLDGDIQYPDKFTKTPETETFELKCDPHMVWGQKIILKGRGHRHFSTDTEGDAVIIITESTQVDEWSKFKIINGELHYKHEISLIDALLGFEFQFKHLGGTTITIKSDKILENNTFKLFPKLGFPKIMRNPFGMILGKQEGDLILHFTISKQSNFTKEQKDHLIEALGPPSSLKNNDVNTANICNISTLSDKTPNANMNMNKPFMFGNNQAFETQECSVM